MNTKNIVVLLSMTAALTAFAVCKYEWVDDQVLGTRYIFCTTLGNPPPPCEEGDRVPGDDICRTDENYTGEDCHDSIPGSDAAVCNYKTGTPVQQNNNCVCIDLSVLMQKACTRTTLAAHPCTHD